MKKTIRDRINQNRDDKDLNSILRSLPKLPLEDPFKKQGHPQKKTLKQAMSFNLDAATTELLTYKGSTFIEPSVIRQEIEAQEEIAYVEKQIEKQERKPRHRGNLSKTPTFKILGLAFSEIDLSETHYKDRGSHGKPRRKRSK